MFVSTCKNPTNEDQNTFEGNWKAYLVTDRGYDSLGNVIFDDTVDLQITGGKSYLHFEGGKLTVYKDFGICFEILEAYKSGDFYKSDVRDSIEVFLLDSILVSRFGDVYGPERTIRKRVSTAYSKRYDGELPDPTWKDTCSGEEEFYKMRMNIKKSMFKELF